MSLQPLRWRRNSHDAVGKVTAGSLEQRLEHERDSLLRYALALTRNQDDARDLYQEAMLRVISAPQAPTAPPAYRAWLFRIIRNLWIDRVRFERRRANFHQDIAARAQTTTEHVEDRDLAIRDAFLQLSTEHQEVLALVDISGFSYKEAGEILSIPSGTVMSRIARARQKLFELLTREPL